MRSSRSRRSRTSDALLVRTATSADAGTIARVRKATWQDAYAHLFSTAQLDSISIEESTAQWRRNIEVAPDGFHTLVALLGDEIVAFASFGPRDFDAGEEHVGELYAIYVLPDIQGRGIGRALMAETVRRFGDEGFGEAVLWVFEDNPRACMFYERAGWSRDGGTKDEAWLGTTWPAVRYRVALEPGGD